MSWRDNLQEASFRSVPFYVTTTSSGVGRRMVLHQYPGKDTPYPEDLGADADEYTITGFIIQNTFNNFDYFNERDALISALKKSGPGKLIHPFLGEITVSLQGKATWTESFDEGGIARFNMTFVQADVSKYPSTEVDHVQAIDDIVEDGFNRIKDEIGDFYVVAGYSINDAISTLTSAANMMTSTMLAVRKGVTSVISEAVGEIATAVTNLSSTVYSACSIGSFISDSADRFLNVIGLPDPVTDAIVGKCSGEYQGTVTYLDGESVPRELGKSLVKSLVEMARFGEDIGGTSPSTYGGALDAVTITTVNTARQVLNREYMINATRNMALMNACRTAIRIEFASYDEAVEVMDDIVDAIDDQIDYMGDVTADSTYGDYNLAVDFNNSHIGMENVRATFVSSMKQLSANLARVVEYQVPYKVTSALELAYSRYNDITRDEEIYDRNQPTVRHPGFFPQGREVFVLSE